MTGTTNIRALERSDLPAVADLVARRFPEERPIPDAEAFFAAHSSLVTTVAVI